MNSSLISVMILSYNNFEYYKDCIDSVLNQSYEKIELIFLDDGSTNFPKKVIENYINVNKKTNLKNYKIETNKKNIGLVKNYNKAITMTNGEFIFYLSVDDVLFDFEVLRDVVNNFKTSNLHIFTGYRDYYDEKLETYLCTLPNSNDVEVIKGQQNLFNAMIIENIIAGCCTPFTKELIEMTGLLDEKYSILEDYPRYLKLIKNNFKIGFIDRKLIKYRRGGITTSSNKNSTLDRDCILLHKEFVIPFYKSVYPEVFNKAKKKKIIGWGASYGFINIYDRIVEEFNISYLVDVDTNRQNKFVNNLIVKPPEHISKENFDEIFIMVFSDTYYKEISTSLNKRGLNEYLNFCKMNKEIMDLFFN